MLYKIKILLNKYYESNPNITPSASKSTDKISDQNWYESSQQHNEIGIRKLALHNKFNSGRVYYSLNDLTIKYR